MMRGLYLVMIMAALFLLLILVVGVVLSARPDYVQVDYGSAFVYPDGENFLLALPDGAYQVAPGPEPVGGCYHLDPPQGGEPFGRAEWAWFVCGN